MATRTNRRIDTVELSVAWSPWVLRVTIVGGIVLLALLGVSRALDPQFLPIEEISIEGEFRNLKPANLQKLVVRAVQGGFFNVNVSAVREAVLLSPWVRDVSVRRVWPDRLRVIIFEHNAVARWRNDQLINTQSQVFSPAPETIPAGLVKLGGPDGTAALVLEHHHRLQRIFAGTGIEIEGLTLSERRSWYFRIVEGPTVIVGREDFGGRLERLLIGLRESLGNRFITIGLIDLRYTNGFAVRGAERTMDEGVL